MFRRRLLPAVLAGSAACQPSTTRPPFTPLPEAAATEIRLSVQEATRQLAEMLRTDSIPPARVRVRDGYIETVWLDSATGRPTRRRPIGTSVVRVRAWADPARPGNSLLIVETLYRPYADPSLPERELEHQVPRTHPVAIRVEKALAAMLKRYGGPPKAEPVQPRQPLEEEDQGLDEAPLEEPPPSEE